MARSCAVAPPCAVALPRAVAGGQCAVCHRRAAAVLLVAAGVAEQLPPVAGAELLPLVAAAAVAAEAAVEASVAARAAHRRTPTSWMRTWTSIWEGTLTWASARSWMLLLTIIGEQMTPSSHQF